MVLVGIPALSILALALGMAALRTTRRTEPVRSAGASTSHLPAPAPASPVPAPAAAPISAKRWLRGVAGPIAGRSYLIGDRVATVGRSPENLIHLSSPEVSRVHCQVRPEQGGLRVLDLRSRLGVFVGGHRVRTALLRPGDELVIGRARFVFETDGTHEDATRDWKQAGAEHAASTIVCSPEEIGIEPETNPGP